MAEAAIIRAQNLHRIYHTEGADVHAVNNISLEIYPGRITAISGRSGAGKTTLLNLLAGLDKPSQGQVWIGAQNLFEISEQARITLRREKLGFVFQNFGLLPLLSAAENVSVPLRIRKFDRKLRDQRVNEALEWVGLKERAKHRPYELSGGEQQRVAIARALAARPEIILADEPTGQLDSQTGLQVLTIMRNLVREHSITMVIVTHDQRVMDQAEFKYELQDGKLTNEAYMQKTHSLVS